MKSKKLYLSNKKFYSSSQLFNFDIDIDESIKNFSKKYFDELKKIIETSNFESFVKIEKNNFFLKKEKNAKNIFTLFSIFETSILSVEQLVNYIYDTYMFVKYLNKKYSNLKLDINIPKYNFKINTIYPRFDFNPLTYNSLSFFIDIEKDSTINLYKKIPFNDELDFYKYFNFETEPISIFTNIITYSTSEFTEYIHSYFEKIYDKDKLVNEYKFFTKQDFEKIEEGINEFSNSFKKYIIPFFEAYNIINSKELFSEQKIKIEFPDLIFIENNSQKSKYINAKYKYFIHRYSLITAKPIIGIKIELQLPKFFSTTKEEPYPYNFKNVFNDINNFENLSSQFNIITNFYNQLIYLFTDGENFFNNTSKYLLTEEEIKKIIKDIIYYVLKVKNIL